MNLFRQPVSESFGLMPGGPKVTWRDLDVTFLVCISTPPTPSKSDNP